MITNVHKSPQLIEKSKSMADNFVFGLDCRGFGTVGFARAERNSNRHLRTSTSRIYSHCGRNSLGRKNDSLNEVALLLFGDEKFP